MAAKGSAAPFTGVVLAGGASSRMGEDKALLRVDGQELVTTCADALRGAGARAVAVVGGDEERLAALEFDVWPDLYPGEGPLGAIITALTNARDPIVVALACDHTAPQALTVSELLGGLDYDTDAVIPIVDERPQVLYSAWRTRCLEQLQVAYNMGERAPRRALGTLQVKRWEPTDTTAFYSANTPAELQHRPRPAE